MSLILPGRVWPLGNITMAARNDGLIFADNDFVGGGYYCARYGTTCKKGGNICLEA